MNRDDQWIRAQRASLLILVDEIGRNDPGKLQQLRPAIETALDAQIDTICAQNIPAGEKRDRIRTMIAEAMRALHSEEAGHAAPQPTANEQRARQIAAIRGQNYNLPKIIPPDYAIESAREHQQ